MARSRRDRRRYAKGHHESEDGRPTNGELDRQRSEKCRKKVPSEGSRLRDAAEGSASDHGSDYALGANYAASRAARGVARLRGERDTEQAMIATLLILTVLSSGGPYRAKPSPMLGVTVNATYPSGRVASLRTDRHGRAYLRVRPGAYTLRTELRPPFSNPPWPCGRLTRTIRAQGQVTRVRLYCSIP